MGLCGSTVQVNEAALDASHFELLKVVGKGGFGKVNVVRRRLRKGKAQAGTEELLAMKRMEKAKVVQKKSYIRMVWTERSIMSRVRSDFLVTLLHAFQSPTELFFVMPFMRGGDLRFHLKMANHFSEQTTRFFAAQLLLALEALHLAHIVFRDVKPENVLLDLQGNIRLSDFGVAASLHRDENYQTTGKAGTPGYMAPEILKDEPYSYGVDLWSYGVLVHELLHGARPFHSDQPIEGQQLFMSDKLSPECRSFVQGLLTINPRRRLGCGPLGISELRRHKFFQGLDWEAVRKRAIPSPIHPDPENANCAGDLDLEEQFLQDAPKPVSAEENAHFIGFEYNTELHADGAANENPVPATGVSRANTVRAVPPLMPNGAESDASIPSDPADERKRAPPAPRAVSTPRHGRGVSKDDMERAVVTPGGEEDDGTGVGPSGALTSRARRGTELPARMTPRQRAHHGASPPPLALSTSPSRPVLSGELQVVGEGDRVGERDPVLPNAPAHSG